MVSPSQIHQTVLTRIRRLFIMAYLWQFLIEHITEELNLSFIKKIHMLLGKFTIINSGMVRREEVRIGGTEWIPDLSDEKKVNCEICFITESEASPLDKALDVTLYLMRAQLFYDGNKRLAMLIGNKIMIENGQGILSVSQKDIKEFYQLLVAYYEMNNRYEIKQFLYDNCIDGMVFD